MDETQFKGREDGMQAAAMGVVARLEVKVTLPTGGYRSDTRPLSLVFNGGAHTLVIGRSAAGKTGLALRLAGVHESAETNDEIRIDGEDIKRYKERERARMIGFVPSNPSLLFSGLASTVDGEIDLSFDLLGVPSEDRGGVKSEIIELLQLRHMLSQDPFVLSGGERVRVGIALALVKRPSMLVLDQVFDALSVTGRSEIRGVLKSYMREGGIVVETHAFAPEWSHEADTCVCLTTSGPLIGRYEQIVDRVAEIDPYLLDSRRWALDPLPMAAKDEVAGLGPKQSHRLAAKDLCFSYGEAAFNLGPAGLRARSGEAIAVVGPNGAGKTTFLMTLGMLRHPYFGVVSLINEVDEEIEAPREARDGYIWAKNALYSFQEPDDQIYCRTVGDELAETSRRLGRIYPEWSACVAQGLGLDHVIAKSPMILPRPIRRMVSIGSVLTAKPPVVLLDEPTAALDRKQKRSLLEVLRRYRNDGGICVFVSHDPEFVRSFATRVVQFEEGKIVGDEVQHGE